MSHSDSEYNKLRVACAANTIAHSAVKRCLFSPRSQPIYFADVILADVFTSFAKVIGDLWLSAAMLLPSGSLKTFPIFEGKWEWIVPCMMR